MRWRVYLVVGGLLALLLVTAGATTAVRLHLSSVGHRLTNTLRPAQVETADLIQAYIDEETGERGYLLTRDPSFLEPYTFGERETATATTRLRHLFADDPASAQALDRITRAADAWRTQAIDPELVAFRNGQLTGQALIDAVGRGKTLFDALRARTADLQNRINEQVNTALQESNAAQSMANNVTIGAAIAAAVLAAVAAWQLRRSFAVPLNRLLTQVRRVSSGDLDHSVDVSGPQEIVTVGETVEAMRTRILAESAKAAEAGRQLARYEEAERIASSLGDTVVGQLFTTSLALQSAAGRYPPVAPVLAGAIGDLDRAVKDLQAAIFELASSAPGQQSLGNQVLDVVDQWEAGVGAAPEVRLTGAVDSDRLRPVAADVVAVVREVLANVVRPSGAAPVISVNADDDGVLLRVTGGVRDHAVDVAGIRRRAEHLGGSCGVDLAGAEVTVSWQVPLTRPATSPGGGS
ncbi:MAG TPA: CHASE3 domain-containing protein [Pseudonocardiaceae bacterium]|nr:CHASE3 domain-containing protein [Pseudonocardiaceae bacterium]